MVMIGSQQDFATLELVLFLNAFNELLLNFFLIHSLPTTTPSS